MGTRNLTMVIDKEGKCKIAQYGQWDGYPEGQGATILDFCKKTIDLKRLEEELKNCIFLEEDETSKNFVAKYDERVRDDKSTKEDVYFYENLITRDLGGHILQSIVDIDKDKLPKEFNGKIYLKNNLEFIEDSLFCEWAYCVNLKTNKLECFRDGKNKLKEFDLENLPKEEDFVKILRGEE